MIRRNGNGQRASAILEPAPGDGLRPGGGVVESWVHAGSETALRFKASGFAVAAGFAGQFHHSGAGTRSQWLLTHCHRIGGAPGNPTCHRLHHTQSAKGVRKSCSAGFPTCCIAGFQPADCRKREGVVHVGAMRAGSPATQPFGNPCSIAVRNSRANRHADSHLQCRAQAITESFSRSPPPRDDEVNGSGRLMPAVISGPSSALLVAESLGAATSLHISQTTSRERAQTL